MQSKTESFLAQYCTSLYYESHSAEGLAPMVFISNSAEVGILSSFSSAITIEANEFHDNIGGVLFSSSSAITIEASEFHDNSARYYGGVLFSSSSAITIEASKFHNNSAWEDGVTVLFFANCIIKIEESEFYENSATSRGGVLYSNNSTITIEASEFHDNSAREAGVLYSISSAITIEASKFYDNSASTGGVVHVLCSHSSTIIIEASEFHDNSASIEGGVLHSSNCTITIAGSNFTNNVSPIGAIIHAVSRSVIQHTHSYFLIDNNIADGYAVIYLSDSEFIGDDSGNATVTFSSNLGSLVAFNSNITFNGYATFVNNQPSQTVSGDFQEGGAITHSRATYFLMENAILNTTMLKMVEQYIPLRANSM